MFKRDYGKAEEGSGRVKFFLSEKGYGFIEPDGGGNDIFIHIRCLRGTRYTEIIEADYIRYRYASVSDKKRAEVTQVISIQRL